MWRTILLGKLSISILASAIVGAICVTQPGRGEYSAGQISQWIGLGVFFILLSIVQVVVIYFLFRKKPFARDTPRDQ
jgi:hypothetical protein